MKSKSIYNFDIRVVSWRIGLTGQIGGSLLDGSENGVYLDEDHDHIWDQGRDQRVFGLRFKHKEEPSRQSQLGDFTPEPEETTIDEFFRIKEAFEKESDQTWVRGLQKSEGSGSVKAPESHKMERIKAGESSPIFDISMHKMVPFLSDSDKYMIPRRKREEKKEKSSWNF